MERDAIRDKTAGFRISGISVRIFKPIKSKVRQLYLHLSPFDANFLKESLSISDDSHKRMAFF